MVRTCTKSVKAAAFTAGLPFDSGSGYSGCAPSFVFGSCSGFSGLHHLDFADVVFCK
jgi:hypothetical protein